MKPKFLQITHDINQKENEDLMYIPLPQGAKGRGEIDRLIGQEIESIEIQEDNADLSIKMKGGGELRVFGKRMLPSFLEANVSAHPI